MRSFQLRFYSQYLLWAVLSSNTYPLPMSCTRRCTHQWTKHNWYELSIPNRCPNDDDAFEQRRSEQNKNHFRTPENEPIQRWNTACACISHRNSTIHRCVSEFEFAVHWTKANFSVPRIKLMLLSYVSIANSASNTILIYLFPALWQNIHRIAINEREKKLSSKKKRKNQLPPSSIRPRCVSFLV